MALNSRGIERVDNSGRESLESLILILFDGKDKNLDPSSRPQRVKSRIQESHRKIRDVRGKMRGI